MAYKRYKADENQVDQTPSWLLPDENNNTNNRYDPTNRPPTVTNPTPTESNKSNKTTITVRAQDKNTEETTQQTTPTQPQLQNPQLPQFTAPTYSPDSYLQYMYDPTTNEAYTNALAALEAARGDTPTFANTYGGQLENLYNEIVGRSPFQYDLSQDVLYQQAADQYVNLGNMAMMDTMGQAAALTGGYGNSYAQSVGQQAYQAYLQQLNDNIPQYYQMALDAYNAEGDRLMNQYGLLSNLDQREYGQYQDSLANYWNNVNYLQGVADNEYNRGHDNWYNSHNMALDVDNINYNRAVDAYNREMDVYNINRENQNIGYDRLVTMMTTFGYEPTPEELAAVGMTTEQGQVFMDYYNAQHPDGSSRSPSGPTETYDPNEILESTKDAVRNGTYTYTEAWNVIDAAHREGYITDAQRSAFLQEIYQEVRN